MMCWAPQPFHHPSHVTLHSQRVGIEPTHQQRRSARLGEAARKAIHHAHDFEKGAWPLFCDGEIPVGQQHGATICVGRKSTKELPSLASFFSHTPLSLLKVRISASGATWICLASRKFAPNFSFSQKREGTIGGSCV
jgi:hypothetical protein